MSLLHRSAREVLVASRVTHWTSPVTAAHGLQRNRPGDELVEHHGDERILACSGLEGDVILEVGSQ